MARWCSWNYFSDTDDFLRFYYYKVFQNILFQLKHFWRSQSGNTCCEFWKANVEKFALCKLPKLMVNANALISPSLYTLFLIFLLFLRSSTKSMSQDIYLVQNFSTKGVLNLPLSPHKNLEEEVCPTSCLIF